MDIAAYLVSCIVFSVSPGAGAINSMGNAISNGYKVALSGVIGLQAALALHIIIVYLGLGAVLSRSPDTYLFLKIIGVAYLAYLGFEKIIGAFKENNSPYRAVSHCSMKSSVIRGFWVNLTNPKSIIFLAAFLPQFVVPSESILSQYLTLGLIVIVVDTMVMVCYILASLPVKQYLSNIMISKLINIGFGLCFIGIAVALYQYEA